MKVHRYIDVMVEINIVHIFKRQRIDVMQMFNRTKGGLLRIEKTKEGLLMIERTEGLLRIDRTRKGLLRIKWTTEELQNS